VGKGGDEVSVARFIADQRTFYRVPYAVCCVILARVSDDRGVGG